ncbi:hypothetical protein ABKV19_022548 [Rosa sericea]
MDVCSNLWSAALQYSESKSSEVTSQLNLSSVWMKRARESHCFVTILPFQVISWLIILKWEILQANPPHQIPRLNCVAMNSGHFQGNLSLTSSSQNHMSTPNVKCRSHPNYIH